MQKTTLNIKMLYHKMGNAEKKIADWIFLHPNEIVPLSIGELADQCGCSEATIVRFSRRLGFPGYQGLKIALAHEEGLTKISDTITAEDTCSEIFAKLSNDLYCTIEMTRKNLDPDALTGAAESLRTAKKIVIFALGNSVSVAMDMQYKFLRMGCDIAAYCDNHMQAMTASHLHEGDVAVGISHSGASKDIVEAIKIARESGAKTIAITNHGKSPIIRQCDYALTTVSNETQYSLLALNSRIAQLTIVDSLYYYVLCRNTDNYATVRLTEKILQTKKY